MSKNGTDGGRVLLAAALLIATMAGSASALPEKAIRHQTVELAQAHGTEPRELEPRYQPAPPPEKSWYNSSYIFGMTRGVAESTIHPAGKVPLFLLTVPLDTVLLPFAAIGGLFG